MHAMYFRGCTMASYGGGLVDMPPPDWCITTLRSLTTKYEHLADSRKVKPPFAEAVLNSFKSKLLNLVSSQALYDLEESDGEPEWPMAGECSAPFLDLKPADCVYDGGSLAAPGNYLTVSPADIVDTSSSHCIAEESDMSTALLSTSQPAASSIDASSPYVESDSLDTTAAQHNDDGSDLLATLPPSIEEALRRFLADSRDQLLSETFTTFADAECSSVSGTTLAMCAPVAAAAAIACQDAESDDDRGQFMDESGSSSPESIPSPEATLEFISAADPVDLFVKNFVASGGAAPWNASAYAQPLEAALAASGDALDCGSVAEDEEDDESELPPCKRKRRGELESKDAKAILRNSLPISPRKRSRSVSRRKDGAAAVPFSSSSGPDSPPPLLNLCISSTSDASPTEA